MKSIVRLWRRISDRTAAVVDRLYGYDVFVAHRRVDGARYAEALVERLDQAKPKLSSFIDKREYGPGDELSQATIRNIRKSTMLVVVGSPAIKDHRDPDWLLREIDTYILGHEDNARRIMPINFGDSLDARSGEFEIVDRLRDTLRANEPLDGLHAPPSEKVIADIARQFGKRTLDRVRLRVFQAAVLLLVALSLAAGGAAWFANQNAGRAKSELQQAIASRLVAEGQASLGGRSRENEERLIQQLLGADSIAPGAVSEGGLLSALIGRSHLQKLIPVGLSGAPIALVGAGRRLIAADDRHLRIWNVDTGKEISTGADPQQGSIDGIASSPDQTQFVTAGGGVLQRRDAMSGRPMGTPMPFAGKATRIGYGLAGRTIVSVNKDSTLSLWDASTGTPVKTTAKALAADVEVNQFKVSSDGTHAVSAGADYLVSLWDLVSGRRVGTMRPRSTSWTGSAIRAVAISSDGSRVLSVVDDKLWLWHTRVNAVKRIDIKFKGQEVVWSVAFSPDGTRFVSAASDGSVIVWDAQSGRQVGDTISAHASSALSVVFSPDGTRIYSSGADGAVRIWDVATRALIRTLEGHRGSVHRIVLDSAGQQIVSVGNDSTVRVWRTTDSGSILTKLEGHGDRVTGFAISRNGKKLLSTGKDGQILLWDLERRTRIAKLGQTGKQGQHNVAITADGRRAAHGTNADEKSALLLWDTESQKIIAKLSAAEVGPISALRFSNGGRILAIGVGRGQLRLLDAEDGRFIGPTLDGHTRAITALAFSPNDGTLVSASEDGTLRIWDVATGRSRCGPLVGHKGFVFGVAISPDGKRIVSGGEDNTPRIWDLRTGAPLGLMTGHRGMVQNVEFSPDGSRLITAGNAATLHLWDARSNVPVSLPLDGHIGQILSASFSPDSRYVASGSADGTVRLWDAQTGRLVGAPLLGHRGDVTAIAFNPDASLIVSAGSYSALHLWPGPRAWRRQLCEKIVQNMGPAEWRARISSQIPYACQCPELPVAGAEGASAGLACRSSAHLP